MQGKTMFVTGFSSTPIGQSVSVNAPTTINTQPHHPKARHDPGTLLWWQPMSAALSKRQQMLEGQRKSIDDAENAQFDAIMENMLAEVEAIPAVPGDARTPRQRLNDALVLSPESAENAALLDAITLEWVTPTLLRSLKR